MSMISRLECSGTTMEHALLVTFIVMTQSRITVIEVRIILLINRLFSFWEILIILLNNKDSFSLHNSLLFIKIIFTLIQ